jgi:MoxR-like ATPase
VNLDNELPTLLEAADTVGRIRRELRKVILGQDEALDRVLTAFLASGHVLIEGVPGLGKTLMVLALARTFDGRFARIQFTPDLMPSDVTGHAVLDSATAAFRVRKGPVFTNLLLADEINRAPAKTQAALLEVMQEQQVTIEGERYTLPSPFMALATQNPIEQEGTYPLPEAQLDRFLLKVELDYPEATEEAAIVHAVTSGRTGNRLDVSSIEQVVTAEDIGALQRRLALTTVDERVIDYAVRIVRATRAWQGIMIGAGPRGAIALVRIARAAALLDARDYVVPDDINHFATAALGHRIRLAPELELDGLKAHDVLNSILAHVDAPRK